MAKGLHKLTSSKVKALKDAGRYRDGGGLYCKVFTYVDNYDLDDEVDRNLVERLAKIDVELLKSGLAKHSGMRGIFTPKR